MKARILVVDDEPDALELVEFNLRQAGHEVTGAEDGAEALEKARASMPDLIVLDVMLPEMSGIEVCKVLRRDPATAGIPIIMLTAKASEIDRVLGLELGADDYVTRSARANWSCASRMSSSAINRRSPGPSASPSATWSSTVPGTKSSGRARRSS